MSTFKVSKDGQSFFDMPDTPENREGAGAKGYQTYLDMTKDGEKVFTLPATTENIKGAQAKGYVTVDAFKNRQAMPKSAPEAPSKLMSAAQGAASSMALDFDDEIAGAASALTGGDYTESRDAVRKSKDALRDANPWSYTGGGVVGSLGGAGVAMKGAGAAASALNTVKGAATVGGVQGLGASEGSVKEQIADTAIGAATGGALQKVMGAIPGLGKKGFAVGTGLPEEVAPYYLQNAKDINAARPLRDVVMDAQGKIGQLRELVTQGSAESRDILAKEGKSIPQGAVLGVIDSQIDTIKAGGVFNDATERALNELERMKVRVKGMNRDLSTNEGKTLVQQLDETIDWQKKPGDFSSAGNTAKSRTRHSIDETLKKESPAYEKAMLETAQDTRLLSDVDSSFRTPEGLERQFNELGKNPELFKAEKWKALDDRVGGKELTKEMRDSWVKANFDKDQTRGARNVVAYGTAGETLEKAGVPLGKLMGTAVGYTQDRFGKRIGKALMDGALKVDDLAMGLPAKFSKVLLNAASRGPGALATTHMLMVSQYPEYVEALGKKFAPTDDTP